MSFTKAFARLSPLALGPGQPVANSSKEGKSIVIVPGGSIFISFTYGAA